jgi:hypothetical protein
MRSILGLLFISSAFQGMASLSIEGFYQGKNLYVQSSICGDGFGYCTTKVTVNGDIVPSPANQGAFEINFLNFNLRLGQPLFIVIEHHDDCTPKIINPEVLLPTSTFIVQEIACSSTGNLTWASVNEQGKLTYQIEQYKWNKWIVIGEVDGVGLPASTNYEFSVFAHSGKNKVRVSQRDNSGRIRSSREVFFENKGVKTPILVRDDNFKTLNFRVEGKGVKTKYEVYDAYGNILKKGLSETIDFSNLGKGVYYVNYDNKNEKVIKK